MAEESYDLRESLKAVRELYPVLRDAHGNIIDGNQRLIANPDWREESLPWIKTRIQLTLARIIANTHRRRVSRAERAEQIEKLAQILMEEEGIPREELISEICRLTTFSDDYVRRLLPDRYKIRPGVGGAPSHERVGLSPTQDEDVMEDFQHRLEELGIMVAEDGESLNPSEYVNRYFQRYLQPDEDYLAWSLGKRYDLSEEEAKKLIQEHKPKKPQTRKKTERRPSYEPSRPTCRCPLCRRDGADRNQILLVTEDPELSQMTMTEFIQEALS